MLDLVEGRSPASGGGDEGEIVGVLSPVIGSFDSPGLAAIGGVEEVSVHVDVAEVTTTDPNLVGSDVGSRGEGEGGRGVRENLGPVLTIGSAVDCDVVSLSSSTAVLGIIAVNAVEVEWKRVREELRSPSVTTVSRLHDLHLVSSGCANSLSMLGGELAKSGDS